MPVDVALLPFDGAPFGVLTACNPLGRLISSEDNQARDQALAAHLHRAGWASVRATGRSPGGQHREPGFAVPASQAELLRIAETFEQTAIFWFDGRVFWLVPVRGNPVPLPAATDE